MRLKIIACKAIQRELASVAWCCPNALDITTMRQQYHNVPTTLTQRLQAEIDSIESGGDHHTNESGDFDAIVLGYGLCSNGVVGLHSSKYPIVIPRIHDCISLLMGSKDTYQHYFDAYPGTYFFTKGWLECGETQDEAYLKKMYLEYMERYDDEEIVQELMEIAEELVRNYKNSMYIGWPGIEDSDVRKQVRENAESKNWNYLEIDGSPRLLQMLVNGEWNEEEFLVVQPGQTVIQDPLGKIISAK